MALLGNGCIKSRIHFKLTSPEYVKPPDMLHICQHTDQYCLHMIQYPTLHRWDAKSHMVLSQPALVRGFKGHAQLLIFQKTLVQMF